MQKAKVWGVYSFKRFESSGSRFREFYQLGSDAISGLGFRV